MSALKDSSIYYIIEKWAYGHIDYWELDLRYPELAHIDSDSTRKSSHNKKL